MIFREWRVGNFSKALWILQATLKHKFHIDFTRISLCVWGRAEGVAHSQPALRTGELWLWVLGGSLSHFSEFISKEETLENWFLNSQGHGISSRE